MSWLPVTFTTCGHEQGEGHRGLPGMSPSCWGVGFQTAAPRAPRSSPHCRPGPTHRLVGDDELDDREGIEDSDGGDVPGRQQGCQGVPAVRPGLGLCLVPPSHSPEVDLVLLPQHPLVLARQVGHTQVLLEGEGVRGSPGQGEQLAGLGAGGEHTLVRMTFLS